MPPLAAPIPSKLTVEQRTVIDVARGWGAAEPRVRALLLKGSIAAGRSDALSDIDLVIVTERDRRAELWAERRAIAEALGDPLGLFDEAPWQAPFTAIALYDGPTKVDLFFQEGEAETDPWLREGFVTLLDKAEVAAQLERRLAAYEPPSVGEEELRELDTHAWDWIWWIEVKLRRGERWMAWVELAWFFDTILVRAHNLLAGEPWRGTSGLADRLGPQPLERMDAALPRSAQVSELERALCALADLYVEARTALARERGVELPDELMRQVRGRLGRARRLN